MISLHILPRTGDSRASTATACSGFRLVLTLPLAWFLCVATAWGGDGDPQANLSIAKLTFKGQWGTGQYRLTVNPPARGWALDPAFVVFRSDTNPPLSLAVSACSGVAPCTATADFALSQAFTGTIVLAVSGRVSGKSLQLADVLGAVAVGTVPIQVPKGKVITFDTAGINPGVFHYSFTGPGPQTTSGSGQVEISQSCDWHDLPMDWPYRFDPSVRPMYGNMKGAFGTSTYPPFDTVPGDPNQTFQDFNGDPNDSDHGSDVDVISWRDPNNGGAKTYAPAGGWLEAYRDNVFDHMGYDDNSDLWTRFVPAGQEGLYRFVPGQYDATSDGSGNVFYLRHPNGFLTQYAHNRMGLEMLKAGYKLNDWIPAGTLLSIAASSGASGAPHYEISVYSGEGCRQRAISACNGGDCGRLVSGWTGHRVSLGRWRNVSQGLHRGLSLPRTRNRTDHVSGNRWSRLSALQALQ